MSFDSKDVLTFEEGVQRLSAAAKKHGIKQGEIVTSRDKGVLEAIKDLSTKNVPAGFEKWQLPVYLEKASQFYLSFAAPNAEVPEHSHEEGDAMRVIISGSVVWNGQELTAGDWMFIPKNKNYSLKVGKMGVGMFYCYCCSCARRSER